MADFDYDKLLRTLWRYATSNIEHRGITASVEISEGTVETPRCLVIRFPRLEWTAICDRQGLRVCCAGEARDYPWRELDPGSIDLPAETGQRALYHDYENLLTVCMQLEGPWKQFTSPGLFILWVWNAGLTSWLKPK